MSGPTTMVSIRLTEEEILELDRAIGFDGMRNRSDVLRRGLHRILEETGPSESKKTTIRVGVATSQQLTVLKELTEMDASSAAAIGIGMLLEHETMRIRRTLDDSLGLLDEIKLRESHQDHVE